MPDQKKVAGETITEEEDHEEMINTVAIISKLAATGRNMQYVSLRLNLVGGKKHVRSATAPANRIGRVIKDVSPAHASIC